jgi:hypothetical protein
MQIDNELSSELNHEASILSSKNIGPLGFDYRRRTKIERLLFLLAKEFCMKRFKYDLGGVSRTHQKLLSAYLTKSGFESNDIALINKLFEITELIGDLSSSDPYAREDAMLELGGSVHIVFKNLSKMVLNLVSDIERLE